MTQTLKKQQLKHHPQRRPSITWQGWLNIVMLVVSSTGVAYAATRPSDVPQSYNDRLAVFFGAVALYALAIVVIVLTKGAVTRWLEGNRLGSDDENL